MGHRVSRGSRILVWFRRPGFLTLTEDKVEHLAQGIRLQDRTNTSQQAAGNHLSDIPKAAKTTTDGQSPRHFLDQQTPTQNSAKEVSNTLSRAVISITGPCSSYARHWCKRLAFLGDPFPTRTESTLPCLPPTSAAGSSWSSSLRASSSSGHFESAPAAMSSRTAGHC